MLHLAEEVELRKESEKAKYQGIKDKMLAAVADEEMTVDDLEPQSEDAGQNEETENVVVPSKPPPRKTQKQRRKAAQLLAEVVFLSSKKTLLTEYVF